MKQCAAAFLAAVPSLCFGLEPIQAAALPPDARVRAIYQDVARNPVVAASPRLDAVLRTLLARDRDLLVAGPAAKPEELAGIKADISMLTQCAILQGKPETVMPVVTQVQLMALYDRSGRYAQISQRINSLGEEARVRIINQRGRPC